MVVITGGMHEFSKRSVEKTCQRAREKFMIVQGKLAAGHEKMWLGRGKRGINLLLAGNRESAGSRDESNRGSEVSGQTVICAVGDILLFRHGHIRLRPSCPKTSPLLPEPLEPSLGRWQQV